MIAQQHFKRQCFPPAIILSAVRYYCRYPLSYNDVKDMLAELGVNVSRSTVYCWVQKFSNIIHLKTLSHRNYRGLNWHVDEAYIRVGGKLRYIWHTVDQVHE